MPGPANTKGRREAAEQAILFMKIAYDISRRREANVAGTLSAAARQTMAVRDNIYGVFRLGLRIFVGAHRQHQDWHACLARRSRPCRHARPRLPH